MKNKWLQALALSTALVFSVSLLAGCSAQPVAGKQLDTVETQYQAGGVLTLTVNPELEVYYDGSGKVLDVKARNDDGDAILTEYDGYQGKDTRQVVVELVNAIGQAGYFAEEVESETGTEGRRITIEVEPGSSLPSETFLTELLADVQQAVAQAQWNGTAYLVDYDAEDYLESKAPAYPGGDELVVFYNQNGTVTRVAVVEDDRIVNDVTGCTGQELRTALSALVDAIQAAGYYVEEVENEGHRIELDVEKASDLPAGVTAAQVNALAKDAIAKAVWANGVLTIDWDAEEQPGLLPDDDADDPDDDIDDDDDLDDDDGDDRDDADDDDAEDDDDIDD